MYTFNVIFIRSTTLINISSKITCIVSVICNVSCSVLCVLVGCFQGYTCLHVLYNQRYTQSESEIRYKLLTQYANHHHCCSWSGGIYDNIYAEHMNPYPPSISDSSDQHGSNMGYRVVVYN